MPARDKAKIIGVVFGLMGLIGSIGAAVIRPIYTMLDNHISVIRELMEHEREDQKELAMVREKYVKLETEFEHIRWRIDKIEGDEQ